MRIIDCIQMSPEWFESRLGIPSASNFDKIITTKGDPSKSAKKYMYRLAGEYVSRKHEDSFQSQAMLTGIEREDEARQLYEIINDVETKQVGFCVTEEGAIYGASPDSLVGEDGNLEIKCPNMATHVGYLIDNNLLVKEYFQQVQGQMLVTNRKYTDLMSYYPGIRPAIVRLERDPEFQVKLQVQLEMFTEELKTIINKIK